MRVDQTTGTRIFSINKNNLAGIYPKYEKNSIKPGLWRYVLSTSGDVLFRDRRLPHHSPPSLSMNNRGSNMYKVTDLIDTCLRRYGTLENFLKTQLSMGMCRDVCSPAAPCLTLSTR